MTLIDYFNAFRAVSKIHRLSANARSLYIAILGEFNSLQYPPTLKLQNTDLQHLSGINSTCSFDSARNALINAELISHKKQIYSLKDSRKTLENLQKDFRNSLERVQKDSFSSMSISKNNIEKEIKKDEDEECACARATTTATPAFKDNGWVSAEAQETWFDCEKEEMNSATMQKLYPLEQMFGTKAVCDAVIEASARNQLNKLTYNYVEKILQSQMKGESKNARNDSIIDNSQYAGIDIF